MLYVKSTMSMSVVEPYIALKNCAIEYDSGFFVLTLDKVYFFRVKQFR